MINIENLRKELDILNSEGTILGLYKDKNNDFFLGSFLKDGSGIVFYSVSLNQLKKYLHSELTLSELYNESKSFFVKHEFRKETKTYLKSEFINSLQCGNDYYRDIPESMKSKEFESKYGS